MKPTVRKVKLGSGFLIINENKVHYELPAESCGVSIPELESSSLAGVGFNFYPYFSEDKRKIILEFDIEEGYRSIETLDFDKMPFDAVKQIGLNLIRIGESFEKQNKWTTFFHPSNLFVHPKDGSVLVAYRGLTGKMPHPDETIPEQVKRMLLLLFSKAKYEELFEYGNAWALQHTDHHEAVIEILRCESLAGFHEVILNLKKAQDKPSPKSTKRFIIATASVCLVALSSVTFWIMEKDQTVADTKQARLPAEKEQPATPVKSSPDDEITALVTKGEIEKAFELDPHFLDHQSNEVAEKVFQHYQLKDDKQGFLKIETRHPLIQFEQAVLKKDFNTIIALKDQIPLDRRRNFIIVNSLIEMKMFKEANQFAMRSGDKDLILYSLQRLNEDIQARNNR